MKHGLATDDGAWRAPQNTTVQWIIPTIVIISFALAIIYAVLVSTS
jgi:hypothetical protein